MADSNPSIVSHLSIGTNRFDQAAAFYDAVLATLGARRVMEHPGAICYGRALPELWLQTPIDGQPAGVGQRFAFRLHRRQPRAGARVLARRAGPRRDRRRRAGTTPALWRAVLWLLRSRPGRPQDRSRVLGRIGRGRGVIRDACLLCAAASSSGIPPPEPRVAHLQARASTHTRPRGSVIVVAGSAVRDIVHSAPPCL